MNLLKKQSEEIDTTEEKDANPNDTHRKKPAAEINKNNAKWKKRSGNSKCCQKLKVYSIRVNNVEITKKGTGKEDTMSLCCRKYMKQFVSIRGKYYKACHYFY